MYSNLQKQSPEMFYKKDVLRNFTKFAGEHLCQSLFFKKETLAQVFSCKFCETFKNTFLHRTPLVTASEFGCFSLLLNWVIASKIWLSSFSIMSKTRVHMSAVIILPDMQFYCLRLVLFVISFSWCITNVGILLSAFWIQCDITCKLEKKYISSKSKPTC